jgi:uncharacterized protein YjiS (DUF1127 family)
MQTEPTNADIDFARLDYRALTAAQQDAVRQRVMLTAREERSRAFALLFTAIGSGIARLAAQGWRRLALRSRRRKAAEALQALDDRMLRDVGIGRSEIWSVTCGCKDATRRPRGVDAPTLARAPSPSHLRAA